MADNGAGADLGGTGGRSTDRVSNGAFGDLTAQVDSDDFVDSILNAVDRDVTARAEAGLLTGETAAVVSHAPTAPREPVAVPTPIDPFLTESPAPTAAEQATQAGYDDFWATSPETSSADDALFSPSTASGSADDQQWSGAPTEFAGPDVRPSSPEPTGSPLRMMMSNEPRFVMAAGLLIALGLICVVIGAIVLT